MRCKQATLRRLKMSQVTRLSQPPSDLSNSSVLQDVPSVAVENGLLVQQQDGWLNTATSTKSDFEGAALQQHGQGIGLATSSYGMSYHPNSTCQIPATTNNRSDQEDVSVRQPKAGRIDKPSTARSSGAKMSMRGQLLHQNTFQPQEQGPAVDHHQGIVSGQQEAVCGTIIDVSNTDQDDTNNVSHNTFLSNKQQGKQQQQQHKENNWHLEQEIQYCVPDIAVPSNVCPKKDGRECVLDQSPIEFKNVKRKSAPENDPVLITAEQDHTKVVDSRPKKAKTTAKLLAALEAYSIDL
uniref:Uncharacterized protein n=1 Tax=Heterosigma akashiwo TaxID=2829 RepID=A0A7S3UUS3_HETAK